MTCDYLPQLNTSLSKKITLYCTLMH